MYLALLEIKNFRRIETLALSFSPGLNILLGENNIGKTTVVDALRALLTSPDEGYTRLGTEDLHNPNVSSISFRFIFKGNPPTK